MDLEHLSSYYFAFTVKAFYNRCTSFIIYFKCKYYCKSLSLG